MTMKKYMFIIVAAMLVLFGGQANAQRCLPGMQGIELRGGFTDGFGKPVDFYTGIAMSTYTKHANRWVVGTEYLQKSYGYRDMQIPRAQFTLEGGYFLKFLSDPSKTFFLSIGGSALAGYETVNWGDKQLPDGSLLTTKDAFIYGGAVTLELESYITDRIVLLATIRERCLWGSKVGLFSTVWASNLSSIKNKNEYEYIESKKSMERTGVRPVRKPAGLSVHCLQR